MTGAEGSDTRSAGDGLGTDLRLAPGADRSGSARGWLLARSPLLVPLLVICVGFWPGNMNADTLSQIDQVAGTNPINDHHAPILAWLWSLVWPLGAGPGFALFVQTAAFLVGAYLVARAAFRPFAASVLAAVVALWPAVFGNIAVIGRDTWFIVLLLLSVGCVIWATRLERRPARLALLAALAFAFLCLATRQNAAAAVVVALVAAAAVWLAPDLRDRRRLVRLGVPLLVGVTATIAIVAVQLAAIRIAGTDRVHPEQYLYLYDLAAFSREDGTSAFPRSVYASDAVGPLAATSSLDSIIPLVFGPDAPIPMPRSAAQVSEMQDAWVDEVTEDPIQYAGIRWDAWLRQIGITQAPVWIYHPVVDPNQRGFATALEGPNDVVRGYQELFADDLLNGGILHRVWIYLLVAAAAAVVLLRRRPALAIVGGLALTAWTYQAGLFFGTMGSQYRLEFPVVTVTVLAAAIAVKALLDGRRREVSPAVAPPPRAAAPTASG